MSSHGRLAQPRRCVMGNGTRGGQTSIDIMRRQRSWLPSMSQAQTLCSAHVLTLCLHPFLYGAFKWPALLFGPWMKPIHFTHMYESSGMLLKSSSPLLLTKLQNSLIPSRPSMLSYSTKNTGHSRRGPWGRVRSSFCGRKHGLCRRSSLCGKAD